MTVETKEPMCLNCAETMVSKTVYIPERVVFFYCTACESIRWTKEMMLTDLGDKVLAALHEEAEKNDKK